MDEKEMVSDQNKGKEKKSFISDFFDVIESTLITAFVLVMVMTYILHPVSIDGNSMLPTLENKDKIFMNTVFGNLSYGDIVIIDNDAAYVFDENNKIVERETLLNECIIKRVIAVAGQEIDIDFNTGEVKVDGKILDEPYINALTSSNDNGFEYPITIPEGYYFVMGDNRNASTDSRNSNVGLIKQSQIYGQAIIKYSPLSEIEIL